MILFARRQMLLSRKNNPPAQFAENAKKKQETLRENQKYPPDFVLEEEKGVRM